MPWVLQDSAPQEQSAWLTEHLAQCEACREEFAQQSQLRLALALPTDVQLDPEVGLKRLMTRIDDQVQETTAHARSGTWFQRALVAAVLVQALGIGVLGVKLWSEDAAQPYRTLSQLSPVAMPGAIHVVPDANMKLADWDSLLHSLQLQVVGGPNDVGAYTVVPEHATATQDTLQQLRAMRGIRLAEPATTSP
jgi:hypothetical protein